MTNPLYVAKDFTLGEFAALVQKVGGADIVRAILRDEKLIQVIDPPQPEFVVDDLFVSSAQQLANARRWNTKYSIGFTDEDFARLGPSPMVGEGFVRPVLVMYLPNEKADKRGKVKEDETFELWWKIAASVHPDKYRWPGVKSDSDHLRLLNGITHPGKCLRWEVIDLAANRDEKPRDVRSSQTSPHAGILAAAAHFPKWVQAMHGKTVPYVSIAGYELNVPDCGGWTGVPFLHWDAVFRQVKLYAFYAVFHDGSWAVPSLREPACRQAG